MPWTSVAASQTFGIEAQHLLRWSGIPVCAVKQRSDHWECSCLHLCGKSATIIELPLGLGLEAVQSECEHHLINMGWISETTVKHVNQSKKEHRHV